MQHSSESTNGSRRCGPTPGSIGGTAAGPLLPVRPNPRSFGEIEHTCGSAASRLDISTHAIRSVPLWCSTVVAREVVIISRQLGPIAQALRAEHVTTLADWNKEGGAGRAASRSRRSLAATYIASTSASVTASGGKALASCAGYILGRCSLAASGPRGLRALSMQCSPSAKRTARPPGPVAPDMRRYGR
jgi:hypothetical protein